jgi:hypothetical protein
MKSVLIVLAHAIKVDSDSIPSGVNKPQKKRRTSREKGDDDKTSEFQLSVGKAMESMAVDSKSMAIDSKHKAINDKKTLMREFTNDANRYKIEGIKAKATGNSELADAYKLMEDDMRDSIATLSAELEVLQDNLAYFAAPADKKKQADEQQDDDDDKEEEES